MRSSALFTGLFIALAPTLASAAITVESDSTTFLTGISIDGVQSWDSLAVGPIASPSVFSIGPVSVTASAPGGLRAVANTGNASDLYLTTANPGDAITLDFTGQNVNALGLEFFLTELSGSISFTDVDIEVNNVGGDTAMATEFSFDGSEFRGFNSTTALTTAVITPQNPFVYATVDATSIQVIPEPATLALLGLGGAALLRRRR